MTRQPGYYRVRKGDKWYILFWNGYAQLWMNENLNSFSNDYWDEIIKTPIPAEPQKETDMLNMKQIERVGKMLEDCASDAWDEAIDTYDRKSYSFDDYWKNRSKLNLNHKP